MEFFIAQETRNTPIRRESIDLAPQFKCVEISKKGTIPRAILYSFAAFRAMPSCSQKLHESTNRVQFLKSRKTRCPFANIKSRLDARRRHCAACALVRCDELGASGNSCVKFSTPSSTPRRNSASISALWRLWPFVSRLMATLVLNEAFTGTARCHRSRFARDERNRAAHDDATRSNERTRALTY